MNKPEEVLSYGRVIREGDYDFIPKKYAIEAIKAARAIPKRQCDVGGAVKQHARFKKYCEHIGSRCFEVTELRNKSCTTCFSEWSQMPYESEASNG